MSKDFEIEELNHMREAVKGTHKEWPAYKDNPYFSGEDLLFYPEFRKVRPAPRLRCFLARIFGTRISPFAIR